jgi:hypothetical protein
MKLKRSMRLVFNKGRKEDKNKSQRKSVTFAHGSKAEIPKVEGRQPVDEWSERGDNATRDESCADSISDRQDEAISFVSDESYFYARQDEEIAFGEPTNKPAKKHVGGKKKNFSVFATMQQKLKELRPAKSKKDKQPTLNFFEVSPEEAAQYQPSEEEPLFSLYENWEKFMDTVAFPEKHLEEPYRHFIDYVTTNANTGSSKPLVPNRNRNPYQQFKENLGKPVPSQTTEPLTAAPAELTSLLTSGMDNMSYALGYATEFLLGGNEIQDEKSVNSVRSFGDEDDSTCADDTPFPITTAYGDATTVYGDATTFADTTQVTSCDRVRGAHDHVEVVPSRKSRDYELVFRIYKERGEPVGMSLIQNKDWSGLYINSVDQQGKFATTQLSPGMKVVEINGRRCPNTIDEAVNVIFDTHGRLELTIEDEEGLYGNGITCSNMHEDAITDIRETQRGFLVNDLRLG